MKTAEQQHTEAAAVAEQGAPVAPENKAAKKGASPKKDAPKGDQGAKKAARRAAKGTRKAPAKKAAQEPAKEAKPASKKPAKEKTASKKTAKAAEAAVPREFSKKSIVLDLLRRPTGATLAEIMKATNWQAHTVRGFICVVPKKQGVKIESSKNEAGERVYTVAK